MPSPPNRRTDRVFPNGVQTVGYVDARCTDWAATTTPAPKPARRVGNHRPAGQGNHSEPDRRLPNETKPRLRAEALIQDDNRIAAYDILKSECELVAERVSIIDHYQECPADLVASVSDLIYAAPRLGIQEMTSVRRQFRKKYGRTFKNNAMNNEGGVLNQKVITNLALQPPTKATVNLYMEKICKQYEVDWTPSTIELSQRHVVPQAAVPEIPVTTGMQQTDRAIVEGRPRNLASLDVLPPPPPVAPGYQKDDNNGNNGNDTSSMTSNSSRSSLPPGNGPASPGGGSLPVAIAFNATEVASPGKGNIMDLKSNHVSCY